MDWTDLTDEQRAAGQALIDMSAKTFIVGPEGGRELPDDARLVLDKGGPTVQSAPMTDAITPEREAELLGEIAAELSRARAKFPGKNATFAALIEEVGELATAIFGESADAVQKEAVQVAVMAMRIVLDGDHVYEPWRAARDLDPLDPALREGRTND